MATTNPSPKGRKALNFDFNIAKQSAIESLNGLVMNIAHDKAKIERYQAFMEERGLDGEYFAWETKLLNEDAAQA
jgi:hypothetical protein